MGDAPVRTRKRKSRTSDSSDDGGDGKKRGRPRVEKHDESAADRRRTQIRMAQRAYRQRKESTLDELNKRVSELTKMIELMNKAFVDCRDRLMTAGLPEALFQGIQETSTQFEALMECVRNPDEKTKPAPDLSRTTSESNADVRSMKDTEPKNVPSWLDETVLNHSAKDKPASYIGMGYTTYVPNNMQATLGLLSNLDQPSHELIQHKAPHPNSLDAFRMEIGETSSIPSSLRPIMTYSFQESTFGRRLHRASLERGYQLLLDAARRPQTYDRVFRLSLMIRDRTRLIAAIKAKLDLGPHENLDSNAPLIHVGGAGTHYPRRDPFGKLIPKVESYNLGFVGPHMLALLDNAARDNLTTDMTVDIAGFEGEWFDPYDVEGYLNEKGIFIDPSSSFAEAEVTVWTTPTPSSTPSVPSLRSTASSSSPETIPQPFNYEQLQDLNRSYSSEGDWNEYDFDLLNIMNMSDIGFSDADTGSWMNFLQPGQSVKVHNSTAIPTQTPVPDPPMPAEAIMWEGSGSTEFLQEAPSRERVEMFQRDGQGQGKVQQKRAIIIDVAKFIKVMVVSGVCIGRTPGYKRKDVDRALALASFDAF